MQKIIEIEQHLLFFIDFIRVPKYRVRPIMFTIPMNLHKFSKDYPSLPNTMHPFQRFYPLPMTLMAELKTQKELQTHRDFRVRNE